MTLTKYATQSVPRYTSYPTAPHFHAGIGARDYARWLAQLDPAEPVSLYLHVPFCRQLCWYCGCNMKLASRAAPIAQYAGTLMREVSVVAGHLPGRFRVSHLHWGGGTPTALAPNDLECAMEVIAAHFDIADGAELAIESDPRTLTGEMISRIGQLGFTRASFGVQEFDPQVQAAINRIQPPRMVRTAVEGLRDASVQGINFDLIYGLPHQTTGTLLDTIAECVAMQPDRIALFGYAHVPWMARKQRMIDPAALPGAAERLDQAQAAARALTEAGYVAVGMDHFALPDDPLAIAARDGTLRRNFQGYTTDRAGAMLGMGATSIGRTPAGYVQNIAETGAWARAVEGGSLPVAKGVAVTREDALRGYVIERLMCAGEVELDRAGTQFGAAPDWYAGLEDGLAELCRDGVIVMNGGRIAVTETGAPLVRIVASVFDEYLPRNTARHAVAV